MFIIIEEGEALTLSIYRPPAPECFEVPWLKQSRTNSSATGSSGLEGKETKFAVQQTWKSNYHTEFGSPSKDHLTWIESNY